MRLKHTSKKVNAVATRAPPQIACAISSMLGNCYYRMGKCAKAIALLEEYKKIAKEVGGQAGVGSVCGNRNLGGDLLLEHGAVREGDRAAGVGTTCHDMGTVLRLALRTDRRACS